MGPMLVMPMLSLLNRQRAHKRFPFPRLTTYQRLYLWDILSLQWIKTKGKNQSMFLGKPPLGKTTCVLLLCPLPHNGWNGHPLLVYAPNSLYVGGRAFRIRRLWVEGDGLEATVGGGQTALWLFVIPGGIRQIPADPNSACPDSDCIGLPAVRGGFQAFDCRRSACQTISRTDAPKPSNLTAWELIVWGTSDRVTGVRVGIP